MTANDPVAGQVPGGLLLVRSVLPFGQGWRVGLLELGRGGALLPPRFDGFVARADLDGLIDRWKPVAIGAWNAGHAHGFALAWWGGPGDWRCIGQDGAPIVSVDGQNVTVRGGTIARLDVDCVEVTVAPGWERRALRVCPFDRDPIEAYAEEDAAPAVDPAYDLELLESDTAWLTALSGSLAAALGRPSFLRVSPR